MKSQKAYMMNSRKAKVKEKGPMKKKFVISLQIWTTYGTETLTCAYYANFLKNHNLQNTQITDHLLITTNLKALENISVNESYDFGFVQMKIMGQ